MINGILNVYKPQNISSNSIVVKIKKILNMKKVGHTGTLDPLACGVLPICIGSATKISEYLIEKDKTYKVKLKFGILTDTYDLEGKIVKQDFNFKVDEKNLRCVLNDFIGEYDQIPPNFSAVKINGKRAYDLAREGKEFEIKARKVKIYSISDVSINNDECLFTVKCSKGTYIRSLCKDIGEFLGTYGTMSFLERVQSGQFEKCTSLNFESLCFESISKNLIRIDEVLDFPKLKVDNHEFLKLILNGVCVKNPKYIENMACGKYFLYDKEELKGICERKANFLKIIKFF